MGIRELRAKYGSPNVKTFQAFNRAIRAEIPGGAAVLDALSVAGKTRRRSPENEQIFLALRQARAEMQTVVAKRYDLVGARDRDGAAPVRATARAGFDASVGRLTETPNITNFDDAETSEGGEE